VIRAAIYARFSDENQDERSIEDQVRLCREYAGRLNATVFEVYADYALSGTFLKNRPQARRLLADAREGRFDVVIAEGLDRLSRDQEDIAGIFKRLSFAGIKIMTLGEGGEVTELHVGLKGTMNALFVKDLAIKVRRGQRGRVEKGFISGSLLYGYRLLPKFDDAGRPIPGLRRIDKHEANVVRRIFTDFAAGVSPRAIAGRLNAEGIPAPRGKHWNASTINGNFCRGLGILVNETYVGKIVYNRVHMVKDPETGRRLSRVNPRDQWVTVDAPELRIVSDALWQAAQARKSAGREIPLTHRRRPRHLLSGLLRCGHCGGPYIVCGKDYFRCSRNKESKTCSNGHSVRQSKLEPKVLDGVRRRLLAPERIERFIKRYQSERERLRGQSRERRKMLGDRIAALDRQISNVVDAIAEGHAGATMKAKLATLERDKALLANDLAKASMTRAAIVAHPAIATNYRAMVDALERTLQEDGPTRDQAVNILRRIIDRIEIYPGQRRGETTLHVYGANPEILRLLTGEEEQSRPESSTVVAGEGLEPPTLGL
jgi:DNA invertase Pin-like site-specific DNA recombinase